MLTIDRTSHSFLLGCCETTRDKYKSVLERIAKHGEAIGAERCAEIAEEALGLNEIDDGGLAGRPESAKC